MPKLILSRKGVDSSSGGKPSPLIDGRPFSLPIPHTGSGIRYRQLQTPFGIRANTLMRQLGFQCPPETHLDPDLDRFSLTRRPKDWRPVFGQKGAALSHLRHHGVGPGDLFLFFGWFREAGRKGRRWAYLPKAADLHLVYAYLEVGEVINLETETAPDWVKGHPHVVCQEQWRKGGNALFVASEHSDWLPGWPGAGGFAQCPMILTDLSQAKPSRSQWVLPDCFFAGQNCRLSYHEKRIGRPHPEKNGQRMMRSVARGQEFVVEADASIMQWWNRFRANLPYERFGPGPS